MIETHHVSAETLISRLAAARNNQIVPGGGKHILIACMPKSASTFLCGAISNIPDMKEAVLTVGHHRREQELCPLECALVHNFNYVASHHVRYSVATREIMKHYSIFPVILVRNIYDCVVSLGDHLNRESLDIPQAYVPRNFRSLTAEQQYDYIIDLIVPWYASFFASWSEYEGPAIRLRYKELVQNFPGAIERILRAIGFGASPGEIETALTKVNPTEKRFNVGRIGRGMESLSGPQIERIRQQFSFFADVPSIEGILDYDAPEASTTGSSCR
jgi:hypothetical protein